MEEQRRLDQDTQLNDLQKTRCVCTIITVNGVRMEGKVDQYDAYVILISSPEGRLSMIYKHAVSTIIASC